MDRFLLFFISGGGYNSSCLALFLHMACSHGLRWLAAFDSRLNAHTSLEIHVSKCDLTVSGPVV